MNQAIYDNVYLIEPIKIFSREKANEFMSLCQLTPLFQYSKDSGVFLEKGFGFMDNPEHHDQKYRCHYQRLFEALKEKIPESVLLSPLVLHFEW